jgi:hypothetical protein
MSNSRGWWMMMKIIDVHPEFAHELVCVIPYAYWLHEQGKLEKVITSKGMKPFYYFCDNVEEKYDFRHLDNIESGLSKMPNDWIHHNCSAVKGKGFGELDKSEHKEVHGVLDYSQWTPPPYSEVFKEPKFDLGKPYVVISNNYNVEFGRDLSESLRYFDISTLVKMFEYLINKGYKIIYKRPENTEFAPDSNELQTLHVGGVLQAQLEDGRWISDYELCGQFFEGEVTNIRDIDTDISYNELQMKIFANASGFITVNGGGGVLCSYFNKPVVMHVPHGKELDREEYLTKENSYINKLSKTKVNVVLDKGNASNYEKVLTKIKEIF